MAYLFHFVVKGSACSLIISTHYLNALQASARGMNCTTQSTSLFLFNRGRDHKQAQYHPEECASYCSRHSGHLRGNPKLVPLRCSVVSLEIRTLTFWLRRRFPGWRGKIRRTRTPWVWGCACLWSRPRLNKNNAVRCVVQFMPRTNKYAMHPLVSRCGDYM